MPLPFKQPKPLSLHDPFDMPYLKDELRMNFGSDAHFHAYHDKDEGNKFGIFDKPDAGSFLKDFAEVEAHNVFHGTPEAKEQEKWVSSWADAMGVYGVTPVKGT